MKTLFTEHPYSVNKICIQLIFFAAKAGCKSIPRCCAVFFHKLSSFIFNRPASLFLKGVHYGAI
ncbi:DUF6356 family protein [Legionella sp. 227]|uniref:DUF6356 family protein n=1 Tax=Legionella sp. 227 TaxID=3367288 RepID=UPI00370D30E0